MEKGMKKYVLTGGPCCGKTTLINELEKRKFLVLGEVVRELMENGVKYPAKKNEIHKFQEMIFKEQIKREIELNRNIVFLDRGLGDYPAYSEYLLGYIPEKIASFNIAKRYDKVFILDRLPFVDDGLRVEGGDEGAQIVHDKIINSYKKAGYELVFVPVMGIKERVKFILNYIEQDGMHRENL